MKLGLSKTDYPFDYFFAKANADRVAQKDCDNDDDSHSEDEEDDGEGEEEDEEEGEGDCEVVGESK